MRRAAKRDANERQIIDALVNAGCAVVQLDRPLDLLVCRPCGDTLLIEVKNPTHYGKLNDEQEAFVASWPGEIHVVRTVDEALAAIQL